MKSHAPTSAEREAFEAWLDSCSFPIEDGELDRDSEGDYKDNDYNYMWTAWQARAAMQTAEPVAVTFSMRGKKMAFSVGVQSFTLDYEPDDADEFEGMRGMLSRAISCAAPDRAPSIAPADADTLSALLWLYHRLPHGYERQGHIERTIKALAAKTGTDVESCLAERIGASDRAPSIDSAALALEQAAQRCDQQADGTNGAYRTACLQCADAVREMRDQAIGTSIDSAPFDEEKLLQLFCQWECHPRGEKGKAAWEAIIAHIKAYGGASIDSAADATCAWRLADEENAMWESSCGEAWTFIDGGPEDNRVRFCHGCGKATAIAALQPEGRDNGK